MFLYPCLYFTSSSNKSKCFYPGLDVYAVDSSGVCYDIEVQRDSREAIPQRARYNGSLIDAQALAQGAPYSSLPECYVIFITETDVLKKNRPICHIDRVIRETGDVFGDGSHIIYVNTAFTEDSPLGKPLSTT